MTSSRSRRLLMLIVPALLFFGGALVAGYLVIQRVAPYLIPNPAICADQLPSVASGGGVWSSASAAAEGLAETAAAAVDARIYQVGGLVFNYEPSNSLNIYDTASDSWSRGATVPVKVHHPGVAAFAGKVYLTGGFTNNYFVPTNATAWVYDPAADEWQALPDMPGARAAHGIVVIDDKLWLFGGVDADTNPLAAIWVYDPATDTWDTSRAPMPTPREHLGVVLLDGKVYTVGGRQKLGNVADVEVYDPATDTWETRASLLTARSGMAVAAVGGRIFAAGGEDININCMYNQVEAYDTASDTWETVVNMPAGRHGIGSAVIGERWFVVGGSTEAGLRTQVTQTGRVDIFTPGM
jgi:N-acetylneuraminic acid mutarotase